MKMPFHYLAHAPLGVVIASGALVLGLSEEPAARPIDSMASGRIGQAIPSGPSVIAATQALAPRSRVAEQSLSLAADVALIRAQRQAEQASVISHPDATDLTGLQQTLSAPSLAFLDPSITASFPGARRHVDANGIVRGDELRDGSLPGEYLLEPVAVYGGDGIDWQKPVRVVDYPTQMRNISRWLARYYRRDADDVRRFVRFAYESGARNGVDPLLITAVMSIESSLNPKARSHKDARGLMQVLDN